MMGYQTGIYYIKTEIVPEVNRKSRGDPAFGKSRRAVYDSIFNTSPKKPGELIELRKELEKGSGPAVYLSELSDLLYCSIRLSDDLLRHVFTIGKKIGFPRDQVVRGCIQKYHYRIEHGKSIAKEVGLLEQFLGSVREPPMRRKKSAIGKINSLLMNAERFKP